MPWWAWIVLGALLLGVEIVVPFDFWLVFTGLAAIATGLLAATVLPDDARVDWAVFGLLAVVSALFFRRLVRRRFVERPADPRVDDTLVGEVGVLPHVLAPGATGRIELRGTTWSARNAGSEPLEPGSRARVERVEGLLLHVRREGS
jgi:membrane protein implicated in regulation of membrane protease activity